MSGNDPIRTGTFVVELTPAGRAAVAVVVVVGPQATRVVSECFTPNRTVNLHETPFERIVLGHWNAPTGEELILCRRSAQRIEIHCHGGLAAVGAVIESLVSRGCQLVSWHDWLRTEGADPIRADAHIALADAPTERTAAILLDQYHGALATAVRRAIAAATAANWPLAAELLDAVLAYRHVGTHLTTPWRVVLAGRTNVGKSSLINALAGFERAIVSHQPGTTRDVVTTVTAIDGWPVQLADTAGLRRTDDELESAGVRLAVETVQSADLIIAVEDAAAATERPNPLHDDLSHGIAQLQRTRPVIHVRNKIDLARRADPANAQHGDRNREVIRTSAVTGEGIAELVTAIGSTLVPIAPPPGSAVPFTTQQIAALDAARAGVERRDVQGIATALQLLLSRDAVAGK